MKTLTFLVWQALKVYPKGYWIRDCEKCRFFGGFLGADKVTQSVGITGFVECLKSGKIDWKVCESYVRVRVMRVCMPCAYTSRCIYRQGYPKPLWL